MNNDLIDMTNARDVKGIAEHLKPMILKICNRYNRMNMGNHFDDLKQECMISIYTVLDKFDESKSKRIYDLYKWTFQTACRDYINRFNRHHVTKRVSKYHPVRPKNIILNINEPLENTHGCLGDSIEDDTFNIPGYGLDYSDLHNTLNILDDKDKLIVVLTFGLDGDKPLVTRDIARIVKISAPSIKWSLQRSFKRLKDYL